MAELVAAVVQMRSTTKPEDNIASLEALVGQAAAQGAVYVQTPEMTGAICRDREALLALSLIHI